jgi:hypothetical protein
MATLSPGLQNQELTQRGTRARAGHGPGLLVTAAVGLVLLAIAGSVDFRTASVGFKGDEATYYLLGQSLARDRDFAYERKDLIRVWEEYHAPEGIFLKRGKTISIDVDRSFPFVHWIKRDDPVSTRLYFSKAYIYPLVASPFVWVFGTNGFLVLHAILLTLDVWLAYVWLVGRGSDKRAAAAFVLVFLLASVVPVYFVWLTPEVFNFSLVLIALFLWSYKEVSPDGGRFLSGPWSDYTAAALVGVLMFSKPTHLPLIAPLVVLAAARRQWGRAFLIGCVFAIVAAGLFGLNAAITGEFNYQGGYRKTFYSSTGFPFANDRETFDAIAPIHGRNGVQTQILVNPNTGEVFRRNLVYFFIGRYSGLVPYFFPSVVALALFLFRRPARKRWQWLVVSAIAAEIAILLFITPYTWSGGGGPIGNRYFLSFYPAFLFLMPPVASVGPAVLALAIGALFTAKVTFDPFWSSYNYANHAKAGPLRIFPLELTMLNDLPVAANPDRAKRRLRGGVLAYFPDDNAYTPEGDAFWLRGKRRADVILRAPVDPQEGGRWATREIISLQVHVENGTKPNVVTVDTGAGEQALTLEPGEVRDVTLPMPRGVPYKPYDTPMSYVYIVTFTTIDGFVPFLETPPSDDSRFLSAMVTLTPGLK